MTRAESYGENTISNREGFGYNLLVLLPLIRRLRDERRTLGWRGLLRKRGWKLVLGFAAFYLVRDLILYVLIPLAVLAGPFR